MSADLTVLEKALGHTFGDRELLARALTHKSRIYEKSADGGASSDNEQLEFLGDAILGFVVSESLVRRFPSFPEGRLSKLKARLVSAAWLYEVAQELDLGDHLLLGRGEEMSGGREKRALLSDALEALIAALYLDAGLAAVRPLIERQVIGALQVPDNDIDSAVSDHKSALQEMAQALKLPPPRYVIVAEEGPEHAKTFTVEVRLGKDWASQAQGLSKKAAGQKAAQQILQQLTEWGR
ncbi:MAG TPA: ribonuclease III [Bryobacteraceae bacterium]|nr:ribonuclease III [Bryobacteraceae bacterium]